MASTFNLGDFLDDIRNGFQPSVLEVQTAKEIFGEEVRRAYSPGYIGAETAIATALAKVWKVARKYQFEIDKKMPHTALPTPHGASPEKHEKDIHQAR